MKTQFSKIAFTAAFVLALTFALSCSSSDDSDGGMPSSSSGLSLPSSSSYKIKYGSLTYEDQTYKTVKIGTQTWMAENLNYATEGNGSRCYDNKESNCNEYGRLYDWATAMALESTTCNYSSCASKITEKHKGICPDKWHLPSDAEWEVLVNFVGRDSAGTKLKAKSGWKLDGNGSDYYGFSALPGGSNFYGANNIGREGSWWTSSEFGSGLAYSRNMFYNHEFVDWFHDNKSDVFSVRCVKD